MAQGSKSACVGGTHLFILRGQYHSRWWPGDEMNRRTPLTRLMVLFLGNNRVFSIKRVTLPATLMTVMSTTFCSWYTTKIHMFFVADNDGTRNLRRQQYPIEIGHTWRKYTRFKVYAIDATCSWWKMISFCDFSVDVCGIFERLCILLVFNYVVCLTGPWFWCNGTNVTFSLAQLLVTYSIERSS